MCQHNVTIPKQNDKPKNSKKTFQPLAFGACVFTVLLAQSTNRNEIFPLGTWHFVRMLVNGLC